MINHKQLRALVIQPALKAIDLYCEDAEELLIMTGAHESLGGTFLKQIQGPALGFYGCEPTTYIDTCIGKLYRTGNDSSKPFELTELGKKVNDFLGWNYSNALPPIMELVTNLAYSTIICRVDYLKTKEALPDRKDPVAMFNYYKKYYNSYLGKATMTEVIDDYQLYLRGR